MVLKNWGRWGPIRTGRGWPPRNATIPHVLPHQIWSL